MNILITGAAGGIARKVIEKVQDRGDTLYVTVHTPKQLERAKKRYEKNQNIKCMQVDVTNPLDREKLKDIDIDVLYCNAAIGEGGSMAEIDMDRVRHNFEVNVFSNFELIQEVLKKMIQKGSGKIIVMSSLAGFLPLPFLGSYCATKASLIKMVESLQMEMKLLPHKIDIVLIEPGLYATGFNRVMLENKYPYMEEKSYFQSELEMIHARETMFLMLCEKKSLCSIVSKIEKAIYEKKPKKVYKAPYIQGLLAKIYVLLLE